MNAIRTTYPILGFWDTRQGGRSENQDSCGFVDTPHGLIAIVCDGMGGGPAGKEASTLAVQAIADYFCKQQPAEDDMKVMMQNAIEYAHQAIISRSENHPEMRGMGSTCVAVLFYSKAAVVGHIGDSRLYQFRHGDKVFRTEDHSLVADMVRSKELTEEQARLSQQTNVITKALGGKNGQLADVDLLPYEKGDRFLLCTDGIWNALSESDLVKRAAKTPSLAGAVDSIVLQADEIGRKNGNTHDNLSLALFETKGDSTTKVKMNRKAINIIRALTVLCCISLLACFIMAVNLMKPSAEKKLLKQSEISLSEKNDSISRLQDQVKSLKEKLADSKMEVAIAKNEVAAEKQKAADKAVQEAKKITEEAQNAVEEAKAATVKAQNYSKEITVVKKYLRQASNIKKGTDRKKLIKQASDALEGLSKSDKKNKTIYDGVRQKLNYSIATSSSDKAKGHFEQLIKDLEKIK